MIFIFFEGVSFVWPGALPALFLRLLVGIGITEKIEYIQLVLNELTDAGFTTTYKYFFHDLYCLLVL